MNESSANRDWENIRARLERIRELLVREEHPSPETVARVWSERARRYSTSPESEAATDARSGDAVLVFRLGSDRYGIPISSVREVLPRARVAPVPGAPESVAGLIQIRGEIRPVYDLRARLQAAGAPPPVTDGETVIILNAAGREFGIRVDATEDIRSWRAEERSQAGQTPSVAYVTDDLVSVLDMESELWGRKC